MDSHRYGSIARPLFICISVFLFLAWTAGTAAGLSVDDEKRIGKEFYEKLERKGMLVTDSRVQKYITDLGERILSQGGASPFDFTFTVIDNPGINAFATPGGYVYVYSGLITLAEHENELAGVLAHEIAHVRARHIAQIIEKSGKVNIAALAAILAGAFLGGGGEGTAAVASLSLATAATLNLKYSREHEEEADLMGLSYLVSAGYDGKGMLDFLKIMRQHEYISNSVPSYFLTHPGTGDRIRYIDGLLQTRYRQGGSERIFNEFDRVQTILELEKDNPESQLKYFQNRLDTDPDDVEGLYGSAVILDRLGRSAESGKYFKRALERSPDDPDIIRDRGISYFNKGDIQEARTCLEHAHQLNATDPKTLFYLGRTCEVFEEYPEALDLYRQYRDRMPADTDIYYNLAMVYGKMNDQPESHYNFGIYFKKQDKVKSAVFHFEEALKHAPPESDLARDIKKELDALRSPDRSPHNDPAQKPESFRPNLFPGN